MSAPSDKARFYLEHSATELNELERKRIFSREEITSIAKKRNDFEHIVNARGSRPTDYARYIEFEKNMDALRRKRIKRLGVKYRGSGQRTIYFLYNRATKKFSGDLGLWMEYIEFARSDKAYKRLNEIFTTVVRLHPTQPHIWIYAANYFMETQADITNARSYMQRGLRFCKGSDYLWLEYAKLETIYIGKIAGRRRILGLDADRTKSREEEMDDSGMIALPDITAEDINPSLNKSDGVDEVALQNLASAPILTGAIPIAIFDSAMQQFQHCPILAEKFFVMFAEFGQLPCIKNILQHVLHHLEQNSAHSVYSIACAFRLRLIGVHPTSAEFPPALAGALELLSSSIQQHPKYKADLSVRAVQQLLPLSVSANLDPGVRKVIMAKLRTYIRLLEDRKAGTGDATVALAKSLQEQGKKNEAEILIRSSMKQWGANEQLQQLFLALES